MTEEEFINACQNYGICAIDDDDDLRGNNQVRIHGDARLARTDNGLQHPLVGSDESRMGDEKDSKLVGGFLQKLAAFTSTNNEATASSLPDLDAAYPPGKVLRCNCYIYFFNVPAQQK